MIEASIYDRMHQKKCFDETRQKKNYRLKFDEIKCSTNYISDKWHIVNKLTKIINDF